MTDLDPDEFRALGHAVVDWVAAYREGLAGRPVRPDVPPGQVRAALPDLEYRMGAGFAKRDAFCRRVIDLSPPTPPGQRSLVGDLVGGLAKPLIEAVVAIWTRADDNDRMRRDTIRAQLEATRWPTYVDVPPLPR